MDNTTATAQPAPTCTLDLKFSTKEELQQAVEKQCSMKYSIQEDRSDIEVYFANHGAHVGIGLTIVVLLSTLLLYLRVKKLKPTRAESDEGGSWIQRLQTPEGMSLALLLGTAIACGFGIALVAIYKWLGINDDFGQGSGSLIQAIWGSAATITAAVVAIMLALESIKQSRITNELQRKDLDEYKDAVKAMRFMDQAMKGIDDHILKLVQILDKDRGIIVSRNIDEYANEVARFSAILDTSNHPDIELILEALRIETKSGSVGVSVFLKEFHNFSNELIKKSNEERSPNVIAFFNVVGRSYWQSICDLYNAFDGIDRTRVFQQLLQRDPTESRYIRRKDAIKRMNDLVDVIRGQ